ncbi:hybrid sensor histidine kinase/response regulator [Desulfobacter latus]|uniref:histidine kinase n=1 Tax=Desulfobacter latus TaxID=2292 RepID=A0A850T491_9BACT|nr:PAS domain-containing sensor histidine kinase [Desulfobacter latus]NWH03645.1 PAS domain S-box protein [Desulfobacter latus]
MKDIIFCSSPSELSTAVILVAAGIFLILLLLGLVAISFFLKRRLNEKIIRLDQSMQRVVQSEARFQALFDLLPFSCTLNDMSGRIILANDYFCNTAQKPLEEIIGSTMEALGRTVDPEAKKRIEADIKKNGSVSNVEIDVVQNGNTYHILFSSCLIDWKNEKAILSSTVDITKRKRAEEAVKQGEENLRVTLNSIGDAVIVTDINGRITIMNPVAQQLTGWNEKEAAEQPFKTVFNIVNSKSRDPVESPVQKVLSTGKVVGLANHTMLLARDGSEYHIADSGSPIRNDHGEIKGVVLVFRDVTEAYKMAARLRQAEKMEAIGILAGGIAHDFNNILSSLLGFTQLAKMEAGDNETLKKYLDSVSTSGLRARDLVSHILTFSRKSDVKRQKILIDPIIKETLKFIRASLPSNIRIHQDLRVKRARVMGDTTQIHQVLMNLFANAGYAMKNKGGKLEVVLDMIAIDRTDTMQFNKIKPGLYYSLMISDTGCGIPQAIIDRIFEPFFTTKNRGEGTGMGLPTVFGILKEMAGGISVYSEEGIGTTFKVLIPAHAQSGRLDTPPLESKMISGEGNILIVDDEEPIVQSSQGILTSLGYSVTGTTSSREVLEEIEKKPKFYDLVLTDMTMPEMDGLTLARRIKAISPEIPIVLCTGFSEGLTKEMCRSVGICDLIMKPMIAGELSNAVNSALNKRPGKQTN